MYCKSCGKLIANDSVFCQFCGTNQGSGTRGAQFVPPHKLVIKEIQIDFCLKNSWGKNIYPKVSWTNKGNILTGKDSTSKSKWQPAHITIDQLRSFLFGEINKWLAQGWELVETDIDSLFVKEYESEDPLIGSFVSVNYNSIYKYTGARFHVRSTQKTVPSSLQGSNIVKIIAREVDPNTFRP